MKRRIIRAVAILLKGVGIIVAFGIVFLFFLKIIVKHVGPSSVLIIYEWVSLGIFFALILGFARAQEWHQEEDMQTGNKNVYDDLGKKAKPDYLASIKKAFIKGVLATGITCLIGCISAIIERKLDTNDMAGMFGGMIVTASPFVGIFVGVASVCLGGINVKRPK